MKNAKKLLALLLAMAMVFAMGITAFAQQQGELTGGSITIKDAEPGQTYNVYQILYLEGYNAEAKAYAYKANTAWESFIKSDAIKDVYVTVDSQGYVEWKEGASVADFAKLAQKEAAKMAADGTQIAGAAGEGEKYSTVSFTDLKLGYYLVDTTLGTLCSLDTTNPSVEMQEKNEVPGNVKTVQEDSTNEYGSVNDADIGDTVNYKSTITAQEGAQNYVFHDKMDAGLTFNGTVTVTLNGQPVAEENYTLTDYTAEGADTSFGGYDECTFEVKFTQAFCDTLKANDQLVIAYSATVNEKAVIAGNGNKNESKLSFGDSTNTTTTPSSTTITYTWEFNVFKYTQTSEEVQTPLEGAEFILYKTGAETTYYAKLTDGKITGWTEEENQATTLRSNNEGKIEIDGLDADTYYLKETKAPDGYNLLGDPVTVIIANNGDVSVRGETLANKTVNVENKSGSELPSTGGMGTKIFYVLGGILVIGAGILLVARRRMSVK